MLWLTQRHCPQTPPKSREEKSQLQLTSGGVLDLDRIESELRVMCPKMHDIDRGPDKPCRPRIEGATRNHTCVSKTKETSTSRRTFRKWSSQSIELKLLKTLRVKTATVQTWKRVESRRRYSCCWSASRRRRISRRREISRKEWKSNDSLDRQGDSSPSHSKKDISMVA